MKVKSVISLLLCFCILLPINALASADGITRMVNMNIDESKVVRTMERRMYGTNFEWSVGASETYFVTDKDGKVSINPNLRDLYKRIMVFGRQAGTSSKLFKWKEALGPADLRKDQTIWGTTGTVNFGIIEWLKMMYAVDPNIELTYNVNLTTDTLENMADVVEFLTGDGTINYNGGVNWANERKRLGIETPANIWTWEIGNEIDWGSSAWDVESYIDYCKKVIPIIKSVDTDGKIACHASTNVKSANGEVEEWHRRVLEELGDQMDYLVVHYYYEPDFMDRYGFALDRIEKDIVDITGSDRIKLYFSEQAPWPLSTTYSKSDPYQYTVPHTIWGATSQAEFYLRLFGRPSAVATNCHSTHSASWCIYYVDDDGNFHLSPTGQVMETFINYGVGDVLYSNLDTFDVRRESEYGIAGGVIRDKNGNLNVLLTNRSEHDPVTVNFNFKDGEYRLKHVKQITGGTKSADDWYRPGSSWTYNNLNKVENTDKDFESKEKLSQYTFNPLSLYVLQLEKVEDGDKEKKNADKYTAYTASSSNAVIFGKLKENDKTPVLNKDGNLMISSKQLSENFGADLLWKEDKSEGVLKFDNREMTYNVANKKVYEKGEEVSLLPAVNENGELYLPLRQTMELLGQTVEWDNRGFAIVCKAGIFSADKSVKDYLYNALTGGKKS